MKSNLLFTLLFVISGLSSNAQDVIIIPTVVHVIWNTSQENISDNQIINQIEILNQDFQKHNSDTVNIPAAFAQYAGDAQIEFCLAQRDTSGNPTTGITRTYTTKNYFDIDYGLDSITQTALGGDNSWNATKYLNIWVVTMQSNNLCCLAGLASAPYELLQHPSHDGVYLFTASVGAIGTGDVGQGGRTAHYYIGEWLNLFNTGTFPFGNGCADDSITDTPPVEGDNTMCQTFPYHPNSSCGTDSSGEMFMNFMTYTNGTCKNMFTNGQIARMRACLTSIRSGILTSDGCVPLGINELTQGMGMKLSPNPATNQLTIQTSSLHGNEAATVSIINMLGQPFDYAQSAPFDCAQGAEAEHSRSLTIDVSELPAGLYFVRVSNDKESWVGRFVKE